MPERVCTICGEAVLETNHFCVHCGNEIRKENILQISGNNVTNSDFKIVTLKNISPLRKLLIIICLTIAAGLVVFGIVQYTISNNLYKTTLEMLDQGRYSEAGVLLDRLGEFKDTRIIRYQIVYESLTFDCMKELNETLNGSYTYTLTDIEFYSDTNNKSFIPTCIMSYEMTNIPGEFKQMTAIFIYENETHKYNCHGIAENIKEDFAVISKEDIMRSLTATAVKYTRLVGKKTGKVNHDRLVRLFGRTLSIGS